VAPVSPLGPCGPGSPLAPVGPSNPESPPSHLALLLSGEVLFVVVLSLWSANPVI
jgi:hypothetical protein